MESTLEIGFPGGSKSKVTRAGAAVRLGAPALDDLTTINTWRAAHKPVLNTFQAILRGRTRGSGVVVAQRHKRQRTIFGKLVRFPKMELARMDDVAGCRLIFPDIGSLYKFRAGLHCAKFKHKRKNEVDKYDYIKKPKNTGYRGIHDIYEYDVNSAIGKGSKGLLIELQYRTAAQHAWATAVEVIGYYQDRIIDYAGWRAKHYRVPSTCGPPIEVDRRSHDWGWFPGQPGTQNAPDRRETIGPQRIAAWFPSAHGPPGDSSGRCPKATVHTVTQDRT